MATCELIVTCRCRTRLARCWVRLMSIVAPVVGRARAIDWAVRGAARLTRVRVVGVSPT